MLHHLPPALRGIGGGRPPLDHIGHAVELGGLPAVPQLVEGDPLPLKLLGDDRIGAAGAGEAGGLGEGAELDGAGPGPRDLEDGVGDVRLGDEGLIGAVKEDEAVVGVGVVHPRLELLPGGRGASGIVGEAEVDHVHLLVRNGGGKAVLRCAGHVDQPFPPLRLPVVVPQAAGDGVGIHIDGIDRVAHCHQVVRAQDVPDAAAVALGPVGDKDLLRGELHPPGPVVVLHDGLEQEVIAPVGRVAPEGLRLSHLVHRLVHGLGDGRHQRQGHISDAQADKVPLRVLPGVGPHPAVDLRKQITARQLQKVVIDAHTKTSLFCVL